MSLDRQVGDADLSRFHITSSLAFQKGKPTSSPDELGRTRLAGRRYNVAR